MKFQDYFINEFNREPDCIIGCDFKAISQKRPREVKVNVKLVSGAKCAIAKECDPSIISTRINLLRAKSFNPHTKTGDYIKGGEIIVYDSNINNLEEHQPNPLAIREKRGKVHRVHIFDVCSRKNNSVGFIVFTVGVSQFVSLDRTVKLDETYKLV